MIFLLPITDLKGARQLVDNFTIDHYGEAVVRLKSGEPTLKSRQISISHTVGFVAIMVSDKRCGVDIEHIERRVEHLAVRFAISCELAIAAQVLPQNPALLIWCAKEAAYKWGGREGVDFLRDMELVRASGDGLTIRFFDDKLTLKWYIDNNLLIVNVEC